MKKTLKALLLSAAALAVGGISLSTALDSARKEHNATCEDWAELVQGYNSSAQRAFFLSVTDGVTPPNAFRSVDGLDYVLGDCKDGQCSIRPESCPASIELNYKASEPVNGKRLIVTRMPPQLAIAWRQWASEAKGVAWLGSWSELRSQCVSKINAADCRAMISDLNPCWKRGKDQYCRNGKLYGPGQGGTSACTVQAGDQPIACDVTGGAGQEEAERTIQFNDEDLRLR